MHSPPFVSAGRKYYNTQGINELAKTGNLRQCGPAGTVGLGPPDNYHSVKNIIFVFDITYFSNVSYFRIHHTPCRTT